MTMIESLRDEFEHETATTRRHLERVPDDRLDWRPHAKSYTARGLASHLVECVAWTTRIFGGDEFDIDPAAYEAFSATSVADLLRARSMPQSQTASSSLPSPARMMWRGPGA